MDLVAFLQEFGVPLTVAAVFAWMLYRQSVWIQGELMQELDEDFKRLEAIIIKLIDQQKITQLDIKQIKGYIEGIEDIMKRLTNGRYSKRK